MKKLFLTLAAAVLALPLLAGDFPKGSPPFEHSFKAVTAAAAKSGKPIVVVFSAAWCGPCQAMKKDVYPSKDVAALHDKFEWAYLDIDEASNEQVSKKFGVTGIPHIQFLDKTGKPLGNQVGSTTPGDFASTLTSILKKAGGA